MRKGLLALVVFLLGFTTVYSQSGPAGVGNSAGSTGQPQNLLWLDASTLGLSNGSTVTSLSDVSGNGFALDRGNYSSGPTFLTNQVNGLPSLDFGPNDGNDNQGHWMVLKNFDEMPTTKFTMFFVVKSDNSDDGTFVSYAVPGQSNEMLYYRPTNTAGFIRGSNLGFGSVIPNNTWSIFSLQWDNSSGDFKEYLNGALGGSGVLGQNNSLTPGGVLVFGGEQDALDGGYQNNQDYRGEMAEILVYKDYLNSAQRNIVYNYLNAKYGISIGSIDYYASSTYTQDVIGIGTESDGSHSSADSKGFLLEQGASFGNGNYVFAGHDGTTNATSTSQLGAGVAERWARDWNVEVTGTVDAKIGFDFSEGISGAKFPTNYTNYVLLKWNGSSYVDVNVSNANKSLSGDKVYFSVSSLSSGRYTLGTTDATNSPVAGGDVQVWYSYQTGNWSDPTTWTLDGATNPLYQNPTSDYPKEGDKVVIHSGKNIIMDLNDITLAEIEVNGLLLLKTTTGHSFGNIKGSGRISLNGNSGQENFPDGVYTGPNGFADPAVGGTMVIAGDGFDINNNYTFRNLEVNLTSPSKKIVLNNDLTINGFLKVSKGDFQINDNISTSAKDVTVRGVLLNQVNGIMSVGQGNARNQLNLYGDFINYGTLKFTQRTAANYTSEATDGIVDVNFLAKDKDQTVNLYGPSTFYRIEVAKGDPTYTLDISASDPSYFHLYGYANENHPDVAQLSDNKNALGLITGSVRIGSNIDIPYLTRSGNYNISENARLWVDGGSVTGGGNSIVPYGTLEIDNGTIDAPISSGVTIRNSGTIKVNGGTLTTKIIRTSVYNTNDVGGFEQTGGTVIVNGEDNGVNNEYYSFSMTFPKNTFKMSGGELKILGATNSGSFFVASDASSYDVTGGTVFIESRNGDPAVITSTAPVWNLTLNNTASNNQMHLVQGGNSGGGNGTTLAAQSLKVLNDLTLQTGTVRSNSGNDYGTYLKMNGNTLEVGGNFTIQDQTVYDTDDNTTIFNTNKSSTLYIGDITTYDNSFVGYTDPEGSPAYQHWELPFYNLTVDKPGATLTLAAKNPESVSNTNVFKTSGGNKNIYSWTNNLVKVTNNFDLENGTVEEDDKYSMRLYGTNITLKGTLFTYQDGITPKNCTVKLRKDGGDFTINSISSAIIGNLRLNSGSNIVNMTSDLTIKRLEYRHGRMNLGPYNLKIDVLDLNPANGEVVSGGFSTQDMFYMDANASDGGLSLYVSNPLPSGYPSYPQYQTSKNSYNEPNQLYFPIGTRVGSDRYTPAIVTLSNVTDDGYITINPVDKELQTTDLTGGKILSYYWRVRYDGFTPGNEPNVSYKFYYDQVDVTGSEANYVAGGVLDDVPYTRFKEDGVDNVDESNNVITFDDNGAGSFPLVAANYTAGLAPRFVGAPQIFYSKLSTSNWYAGGSNWDNGNNWSFTPHNGSNPDNRASAGDYPQAGDIAIIGYGGHSTHGGYHSMNIFSGENEECAEVRFDSNPSGYASRLVVWTGGKLTAGIVTGDKGTFMERLTNTGSLPNISGDFGDFNAGSNCTYDFYLDTNGTFNLNNLPTYEFPNLRVEGGNNRTAVFTDDVHTNFNFTIDGNTTVRTNNGAGGDITVDGRFQLGGYNGGNFVFNDQNNAHTLTVKDFNTTNDSGISFSVDNSNKNSLEHKVIVTGDITQGNGTIDMFNGNGTDNNARLVLSGDGLNSYTRTGGSAPQLYRLEVDKGSSIASRFTFNDSFTLNGSTNSDPKALIMTNGLLVLGDPGIDIDLTTGGADFAIPSTAGLEVRQGTVKASGSNTGIALAGLLRVSGGTAQLDGGTNNYIEYSTGGDAALEVTAGNLYVGSQVRMDRDNTANGVLSYKQTGGNVQLATKGAPQSNAAVFEVLNSGSSFEFTGGNFTIVQAQSGTPSVATLYLDPATSNVAGSTINFGNGATPANQEMTLYSAIPLNNVTVNSTNSPTVKLLTVPLTVDGDLTINSGATFDANELDITLKQDLVNDGVYKTSGNNVNDQNTYFTGTAAQNITGSGTFDFYNLEKNSALALTIDNDITIDNELRVLQGEFNTQTFAAHVHGYLLMDGNQEATTTTGLYGIVMDGSATQKIYRSGPGLGQFKALTIDNPNDVVVDDGQGYEFEIQDKLILNQGVFDIGGNLLIINENAGIVNGTGNNGITDFNVNSMIRTNSSYVDSGLEIKLPSISSLTTKVVPIGQDKYTPIQLQITNSSAGSIRVRSSNEVHPAIIEDSEGTDPAITDRDNALKYYWLLNASGLSNFSAQGNFYYDDTDIGVTSPYTIANYIPARILYSSTFWDKAYSTNDFEEANNKIKFVFNNAADASITGDYTAGVGVDNSDAAIMGAIPDQVPEYTVASSGNFSDAVHWTPVGGSPAITDGVGPLGAIIHIPNGENISLDKNNVRLFKTDIQNGGTLTVDGTIGHRLGIVSGTGTLKLVSNTNSVVLPSGFYEDFFSCSGGGLEYAGTGSYSVLSSIPSIRQVTFSGSGDRDLSNSNLIVCEDMNILGTVNLTNGFDKQITIRGNLYKGDNATVDWGSISGNGTVVMQGSSGQQLISGDFTGVNAFNRLKIDNPDGVTVMNMLDGTRNIAAAADVEIDDELILGNGLVETDDNNNLTLNIYASVSGYTSSSYVNGPLKRIIANSTNTYPMPVGNSGRFGLLKIRNTTNYTGPRTWEAWYHNNPPSDDGYDFTSVNGPNVQKASGNEYWNLYADDQGQPLANHPQANIRIYWDDKSDVQSNISNLLPVVWDASNSWWSEQTMSATPSGSVTDGSLESSAITFTTKQITFGTKNKNVTPLPIELVAFNAQRQGNVVALDWQTATETNNDHFEIERSLDGKNFERVGTEAGAGTTRTIQNYEWVDYYAPGSKLYYRLKQVDFDGNSEYSPVVSVQGVQNGVLTAYPNPTNENNVHIRYQSAGSTSSTAVVKVLDINGTVFFEGSYSLQELADMKLPLHNVASGLYIITINDGTTVKQTKVMLH